MPARPRVLQLVALLLPLSVACGDDSVATGGSNTGGSGAGGGEQTCQPGATVCADDGSTKTCLSDGSGYGTAEACDASHPTCLDGACVACVPDTTTCASPTQTQTCQADGTFGAPTDCAAATPVCLDGACVVCDPGTSTCADDGSFQTCLPDGSGYETPVVCDAANPVCVNGACVVCEPGTTTCADDGSVKTCLPDGSGYETPVACGGGTPACYDGVCVVCIPGSATCADENTAQTCLPDASGYDTPTTCGGVQACDKGACVDLCVLTLADPTSAGCSFMAAKMDNFYNNVNTPNQNDAITITNQSLTRSAMVQLYFTPEGTNTEQAQGAPVQLLPGADYDFVLSNPEVDSVSVLRQGGVYRVSSDLPISAYHHSPRAATFTNDSTLLLPDHALTGHYVVASYPGTVGAYPSYFTAIGLTNGTQVGFTVPSGSAGSAGGTGVPAVAPGGTGNVTLDRFSFLNVVTAQQQGGDMSGTIVTATQPIWLTGATECANVPDSGTFYCDFIEEQMLPMENWGSVYVGLRAPARATSNYYWRIYGGADGVIVDTNPPQPGFPMTLAKGEYRTFITNTDVIFSGTGPFLPVQYLEGQSGGSGTGDPSMIIAIPAGQYVTSYVFGTGTGYTSHYAQIVRAAGASDIFVDGALITGYTQIGSYEFVNQPISEGSHSIRSATPFGVSIFGYTSATSYAFPGGLRLATLNPL
ncbi:MAG: hypothetical protein U0271_22745 [Polyangiaceae bacterium]